MPGDRRRVPAPDRVLRHAGSRLHSRRCREGGLRGPLRRPRCGRCVLPRRRPGPGDGGGCGDAARAGDGGRLRARRRVRRHQRRRCRRVAQHDLRVHRQRLAGERAPRGFGAGLVGRRRGPGTGPELRLDGHDPRSALLPDGPFRAAAERRRAVRRPLRRRQRAGRGRRRAHRRAPDRRCPAIGSLRRLIGRHHGRRDGGGDVRVERRRPDPLSPERPHPPDSGRAVLLRRGRRTTTARLAATHGPGPGRQGCCGRPGRACCCWAAAWSGIPAGP